MKALEKHVFLRTLNYLRISHEYCVSFNVVFPSALTLFITLLLFFFGNDPNIYGKDGMLGGVASLLAILTPFYIASLAAVATFQGTGSFDEKFSMTKPVELKILERGQWKVMHLTTRHFLSMLFGYCSMASLALFLFTILAPIIAGKLSELFGDFSNCVGWLGLTVFLFIFSHMLTTTILGMYFLSDRIHRNR